jgi:hypothetical protein
MKANTAREEFMLEVIRELVKERDKWEHRCKHPLPKGWSYGDEHPRYGEVKYIVISPGA